MGSAASKTQDEWAERIVLSGAMKEPDEVFPVCRRALMGTTDFYHSHHQVCFAALWSMWNANQEVGPFSLYWHLRKSGRLDDLGKRPERWIAEVWQVDPTGWWACAWAVVKVKELSVRRAIIYQAAELIRDARDGVREPEFYRQSLCGITVIAKRGPR
jgi:replicative DNA helicase